MISRKKYINVEELTSNYTILMNPPLENVNSIRLVAFEFTNTSQTIQSNENDRFYLSFNDIGRFEIIIPPGQYTLQSFQFILQQTLDSTIPTTHRVIARITDEMITISAYKFYKSDDLFSIKTRAIGISGQTTLNIKLDDISTLFEGDIVHLDNVYGYESIYPQSIIASSEEYSVDQINADDSSIDIAIGSTTYETESYIVLKDLRQFLIERPIMGIYRSSGDFVSIDDKNIILYNSDGSYRSAITTTYSFDNTLHAKNGSMTNYIAVPSVTNYIYAVNHGDALLQISFASGVTIYNNQICLSKTGERLYSLFITAVNSNFIYNWAVGTTDIRPSSDVMGTTISLVANGITGYVDKMDICDYAFIGLNNIATVAVGVGISSQVGIFFIDTSSTSVNPLMYEDLFTQTPAPQQTLTHTTCIFFGSGGVKFNQLGTHLVAWGMTNFAIYRQYRWQTPYDLQPAAFYNIAQNYEYLQTLNVPIEDNGFNNEAEYIQANSSIFSIKWSYAQNCFLAFSMNGSVLSSSDGFTWDVITNYARGIEIYNSPVLTQCICWASSLGIFSRVSYSFNGRVWKNNLYGIRFSNELWSSICWAESIGVLCAVSSQGSSRVMYSRDGINWGVVNGLTQSFTSICWSPLLGIFCAVASSGTKHAAISAITSDGKIWYDTTITGVPTNTWQSICWSPFLSIFCAVASTGTNRVMYSSNGEAWTSVSVTSNEWFSICWSPDLNIFCAVASTGTHRTMTSTDGIVWSYSNSSASLAWYSICWAPGLNIFCAVAYENGARSMTSTDGVTWTTNTASVDVLKKFRNITWSEELGQFCAVGDSSNSSYSAISYDGLVWSTDETALNLSIICWADELRQACIISTTGVVYVSYDGETITNQGVTGYPATTTWNSVCWSHTKLCAVASTGTYRTMTSSDGFIWEQSNSAPLNTWRSICWSPELSIFCAVSSDGTNRTMTSSDGITWVSSGTGVDANSWQSVCWSPQLYKFCAVARSGTNRAMISSNGITWSSYAAGSSTWVSVCWSPYLSIFCACSIAGFTSMTSSDGIIWNLSPASYSYIGNSIVWADTTKVFYMVSTEIYYSYNGLIWDKYINLTNNLTAICWAPYLSEFISVGPLNMIKSSVTKLAIIDPNQSVDDVYNNWVVWSPTLNLWCLLLNWRDIYISYNNYDWFYSTTASVSSGDGLYNRSSICWSDTLNTFCALFNGTTGNILMSTDGITWTTESTNSNGEWMDITWSNALQLFCIVARNGTWTIMTSSTGTSWSGYIPGIAYRYTKIVASDYLGIVCAASDTGGTSVTSDGIVWSFPLGGASRYIDIIWAKALLLFIAIDSDGFIHTSGDGTGFTYRATPTPQCNSLIWSDELQLCIAFSSKHAFLYMSVDGITWVKKTESVSTGMISIAPALCDCRELRCSIIVVADDDTTMRISPSQPTILNYTYTNTSNRWNKITWSPSLSKFCIVRTIAYRTAISSDGLSWTYNNTSSTDYNTWSSVCWADTLNLFVAVASYGPDRFMSSSDGITWTIMTPADNLYEWTDICWSSDLELLCAISTSNHVMTSSNASDWTLNELDDICNSQWVNICWSSELNLYCAVAQSGPSNIMISSDGVIWSVQSTPLILIYSIAWSPSYHCFMACGNNNLLISYNGVDWVYKQITNILSQERFGNIIWSDVFKSFIAVSNRRLIYIYKNGIEQIEMTTDATQIFVQAENRIVTYQYIPNENAYAQFGYKNIPSDTSNIGSISISPDDEKVLVTTDNSLEIYTNGFDRTNTTFGGEVYINTTFILEVGTSNNIFGVSSAYTGSGVTNTYLFNISAQTLLYPDAVFYMRINNINTIQYGQTTIFASIANTNATPGQVVFNSFDSKPYIFDSTIPIRIDHLDVDFGSYNWRNTAHSYILEIVEYITELDNINNSTNYNSHNAPVYSKTVI